MALIDDNGVLPARPGAALAALDQLARMHNESSHAGRLAQFLRAAVHAASLFMVTGTLALLVGGGTTMGRNFSWGLLVLLGVGALLRSYIRTHARAFDRAPLPQAAKDLRTVFLYMGIAWGAGAFLALPANLATLPLLLFVMVPCLALSLMFTDAGGLLAFLTPATLITITALFIRSFAHADLDTFILLVVQWGLISGILIRGRRRAPLPAGFALR